MYEQQEKFDKKLGKQEIKDLLSNCEYISHIIFPYECAQAFEENLCVSLMKVEEKNKKYDNFADLIINNNVQNLNYIQINEGEQNPLDDLEPYHQVIIDHSIDFYRICAELFYFMFASMRKVLMVTFHQQLIVYHVIEKKFMIVVQQISVFSHEQAQEIKKMNEKSYYSLYIKLVKNIRNVLKQNINFVRNLTYLVQSKPQLKIQKRDFNYIKILLQDIKQQTIYNILKPIQQLIEDSSSIHVQSFQQNDLKSFVSLQKCQFMCQYSQLYKIRNRSINLIVFNHSKQKNTDNLKIAIQDQIKLKQLYKKTKATKKNNQQALNDIVCKMLHNFLKYIRQNWSQNPQYRAVAQEQKQEKYPNEKIGKQVTRSETNFKVYVKSMKQKFEYKANQLKQNVLGKNQMQMKQIIEYSVSIGIPKPILIVRLITSIALEQLNMDEQLLNWNFASYSGVNVSIQILQRCQRMINKKRKLIVLKTMNEILEGQSLILHCLRSIDTLMVVYTVIDSKFQDATKHNYSNLKNNQSKQIQDKIRHYTELMVELGHRLMTMIQI